jgi:hypothetical protein
MEPGSRLHRWSHGATGPRAMEPRAPQLHGHTVLRHTPQHGEHGDGAPAHAARPHQMAELWRTPSSDGAVRRRLPAT